MSYNGLKLELPTQMGTGLCPGYSQSSSLLKVWEKQWKMFQVPEVLSPHGVLKLLAPGSSLTQHCLPQPSGE